MARSARFANTQSPNHLITQKPTMNHDTRLLTDRNVWLATTRPNGKPHLIPIWFVWVDEKFYICTGEGSVKTRNVLGNPRASVALEDGNKPLIAECRVERMTQPYPPPVVQAFLEKYAWNITTDAAYNALLMLTPEKWLTWQTG